MKKGKLSAQYLKCILMYTPGETLEGKDEMKCLGYRVEKFPTTQDTSNLQDSINYELDNFNPEWKTLNTPHQRAFRASFIRMILDQKWAHEDFIVFGESDTTPVTESRIVRRMLAKIFQEETDVDVIRLFHHKSHTPDSINPDADKTAFENLYTSSKAKASLYVQGSHAFVIPASKRQHVAEVLARYKLPVDAAMEAACAKGDLVIKVSCYNHFYQKKRSSKAHIEVSYAYWERKIAIALSCYRWESLERQVSFFMQQPYQNIHLFVACKNIPEPEFQTYLLPRLAPIINEDRITLRNFPKKNQVSDWIDSMRDLNVDEFDLFFQVDESVILPWIILQDLNSFHTKHPEGYSSYEQGERWEITNNNILKNTGIVKYPRLFAITNQAYKRLQEYEQTPSVITSIMPESEKFNDYRYGWSLSNLLYLAAHSDGCVNRVRKSYSNIPTIDSIIKSKDTLPLINTDLDQSLENTHFIEVNQGKWTDWMKIENDRCFRIKTGDTARVISFSDSELIIKWDRWGTERFVKSKDNIFCLK